MPTLEQVQRIAHVARKLMNPLGDSESPLLTEAGFGDFTLEYDTGTDALTISRGQQAIMREQGRQIENLEVTVADSEVFRSLGEP